MNALNTALFSRLNGTSSITSLLAGTTTAYPSAIYHLQAAEGAPLPYVVFSVQGGGDENQSPHRTKNLMVFVRAYSNLSAKEAGAIDAQIDTALHMVPLTVSGWTELWLARETDVETVENEPSSRPVWMSGGMYRNRLEKS